VGYLSGLRLGCWIRRPPIRLSCAIRWRGALLKLRVDGQVVMRDYLWPRTGRGLPCWPL